MARLPVVEEKCVESGLGFEVVCIVHSVVAVRLLAGHQALLPYWSCAASKLIVVSELMDKMLTGEDQSQADQPNSLAEDPPKQTCTFSY
eukprot:1142964-Pelagomonas_calceolata.AAC.1